MADFPVARNDAQLLQDMTRVVETNEAIVIEVGEIHWLHPHEPFLVWHPLVIRQPETSADVIAQERLSLLKRKSFFGLCTECGLRCAKGHMHSKEICMTCAEENHGIRY